MTTSITTDSDQPKIRPAYACHANLVQLTARLETLVSEIAASALSAEALARSFDNGLDALATVLRSVPIHEGRLLERGVSLLAELNPDLVVLSHNLRLPVTAAALQLVEKNSPHLYRSLTLDADIGARKSYTPDLLILNRQTRIAHLVDIKRSLSSYEVSRIAELKNRMLASALVVPDLLYKTHHRLVVEDVRVVILNAEGQRSDIDGGIWPLSHLDHLLEVTGAGEALMVLRNIFQQRIDANWQVARSQMLSAGGTASPAESGATLAQSADNSDGEASDRGTDNGGGQAADLQKMLRVGFARVPARAH